MSLFQYFDGKSPSFFIVVGTALVVLVGVPDYVLPRRVSFSIFYLIPVSVTAWYAGKLAGMYLAGISAAIWFVADILSGDPYTRHYIPYWNALVRLGFFLIVVFLLLAFKREKIYAREDYLTGLNNRRNFFDLSEKEIKRSQRYGHPFTIAYIDVDDFKSINDRFGHAEGDLLLRSVAGIIKHNIRSTDIDGRLGGDEFSVLLPETGPESAVRFFNKLHHGLSIMTVHGDVRVTFSIGVVTFLRPPDSVDEMIKAVDQIMYSAKESGKDTVKHQVIDGAAG
jgi:diguanylate cyclase (GGDEF)-like protein